MSRLHPALLALAIVACPAAFASTATFATITTGPVNGATAVGSGSIGGDSFGFTGQNANTLTSDPWSGTGYTNEPAGTYTSSTVSNAPPDNAFFQFYGNGTETFTFTTPVTDLILDEFSLGGGGTTTYTFNDAFTVLSCGASNEYGGGCFSSGGVGTSGTVLSGAEANGVLEFAGPVTTLTFSITNGENYNGFDLGVLNASSSATPEPGALALLGTGLVGMAGVVRRRIVRA